MAFELELPNEHTELDAVTLAELVDSDRIEYLTAYKGEDARNRQELRKRGDALTFYVPKKKNAELPLQMKLFTNRTFTLIPNQPVAALRYEQGGFRAHALLFNALGVEFPFGYEFNNRRRAPAGTQSTYFSDSESGWESDAQGEVLSAETELVFKSGRAIQSISTVTYDISN